MNSQTIITIGSISAAVLSIWTLVTKIWKPFHDLVIRVDDIEQRQKNVFGKLETDYEQLKNQGDINALILRSIKVLMAHEIDGDHMSQLKDCVNEIDQMLYKKGGSL